MKRIIAALGFACFAAPLAAQPPAPAPAGTIDYSNAANWLCLPGREDGCSRALPTTTLDPNGYGPVGQASPAANPAVDCFYVYPTVSRDPEMNSDMNAGPEEQNVIAIQFARFASVCRTYAPLYRSGTLAMIPRAIQGQDVTPVFNLAYGDVLAAWRHYLAHNNQGRPFVLIGHSQGTIHLSRLLAEEIEGKEAAGRMLSAMLIGYNVEVPEGHPVGGTFRSTPLCTRAGQTGCIVTYVSFRASNPPPAGSLFGRTAQSGRTIGCTNPANLAGGAAPLDSYWFTGLPSSQGAPTINWSSGGPPPTPYLHTEGLASATCVHDGQTGYLAVSVNADPADPRTDTIPGDVYFAGTILPGWGLHLVDVNLAQGDLIRIVEAQARAYRLHH